MGGKSDFLTAAGASNDLSEADFGLGIGTTLADSQTIDLGPAWIGTPTFDLVFEYISNGQVVTGLVGSPVGGELEVGDFNRDGDIDTDDWVILRSNHLTDLSSRSGAEAYVLGDLTGDLANDFADFEAFRTLFDEANGLGAFEIMLASVPEPSTILLLMTGGLFALPRARRDTRRQ